MKDIYEGASEILAWLGPEGEKGLLGASKIAGIYQRYVSEWERLGTPDAAYQNPRLTLGGSGLSVMAALLDRTWFHRVWIVQEGTVPVRTTFYLCHSTIPADAVYTVARLISALPLQITHSDLFLGTVSGGHIWELAEFAKKRARECEEFSLLTVLETFRNFEASDPRDKIYAALGFAGDISNEHPIEIDNPKPHRQILRDVALTCLYQSPRNLRFLGHASLRGTEHMPATWMLDWL
ncbi:hypothetical protein B0H67DRAFT_236294 [Lasiosphaeris hirsuta]|uniref:Heterokaryon incompatibility domain-containing protein n=1 Tax=Lasiosphaeris hirsuta TaxID=260670 RepID=A0AA40AG33_9PEZI|nr:hypothetical protein B0H67DRAFT_236294 [Lasiosphaeris hirsuta]